MSMQTIEKYKEGNLRGESILTEDIASVGVPDILEHQEDLMKRINAVKGFEYGSGFHGSSMNGSEHNDEFNVSKKGKVKTKSNFSGGIQGGISNGEDIYFNVAFKPVSTIMKDQNSIDSKNKVVTLKGKGRHDPCVVPRAVPIVESMAANVIVDLYLQSKS